MTISRKLWEILSTPEALEALKGTAENLHLEGKAGRSPLTDDLKGYLSQALSGFANSDGGVLVLGLRTERRGADEPDVITAVEPFEGFSAAASEIHSLVGQVVVPIVEGVEVRPIASKGSPTHGYVVVLVPASERPPHRAMLRKIGEREYWKRSGDSFYRMEHFDLEDVFGRRRRPRLKLGWRVAERGREQRGSRSVYKWGIVLTLENEGRGIAQYPMLELECGEDVSLDDCGLDGKGAEGLRRQPAALPSKRILFVGDSHQVIHPGVSFAVCQTRPIVTEGPTWRARYPDLVFGYRVAARDQPVVDAKLTVNSAELARRVPAVFGDPIPP